MLQNEDEMREMFDNFFKKKVETASLPKSQAPPEKTTKQQVTDDDVDFEELD